MKKCFKCGRLLPLTDFYKHSQMADGHLNKCKECTKADVRKNYDTNFEHYQAYELQRKTLPHRMEARVKVTNRMRSAHPDKYKAHNAVNNAIRDGRLEKQACGRCGSLKAHGHHDDYSKPLEVMWLCAKHHKERHRELDALAAE